MSRSARDYQPSLPILHADLPPPNGLAVLTATTVLLGRHQAEYLLHTAFNENLPDATSDVASNLAKYRQRAGLNSSPTVKPELKKELFTATKPSPSDSDSDDALAGMNVKYSTPAHRANNTRHQSWAVTPVIPTFRFADPMRETSSHGKVPEDETKHALRLHIWTCLEASFVHHPWLIQSVVRGDIAGILANLQELMQKHDHADFVEALKTMAKLTKKNVSFVEFKAKVTMINAKFTAAAQASAVLQMGPGVLPLFVLHAMQDDSRYDAEMTLLRERGDFSLSGIITTLSAAAARIEGGRKVQGLAAIPRHTGDTSTTTRPKQQCFNWRDDGVCKRKDTPRGCKFTHEASEKGKGRPADAPPRSSKPCDLCLAVDHVVAKCPLLATARASVSPTPPGGAPPSTGPPPTVAGEVARVSPSLQVDSLAAYGIDTELTQMLQTSN